MSAPLPRSTPRLDAGALHLWTVPLDPPDPVVARLRGLLNPDEIRRADRFRFDRDRRRFTVGRAILRRLLGVYLGRSPTSLRFDYGEKGKPYLADVALEFNLSNSDELALVGITHDRVLGVDVEKLRPLDDAMAIAERFFSRNESAKLGTVEEPRVPDVFFRCWTRKEAYIKAVGDGLSIPLDRFDVTLLPEEPTGFVALDGSAERAAGWQLLHLEPASGYLGAVAFEGAPLSGTGFALSPTAY
ncbi:MAG: 4'-phosphopantetheinyl transferase superfamily protein [Acidobacteriota bacterium]